jgi:hypothetical protein
VVELDFRWKKAPTLEPDWQIEDGWMIEVQGRPTVRTKVNFLPPPDFQVKSLADFMVLGHIMTAMPAINAIHQRHSGGGGGPAGNRELPRSPASPAARARASPRAPPARLTKYLFHTRVRPGRSPCDVDREPRSCRT